jgi:hypothetical protein
MDVYPTKAAHYLRYQEGVFVGALTGQAQTMVSHTNKQMRSVQHPTISAK